MVQSAANLPGAGAAAHRTVTHVLILGVDPGALRGAYAVLDASGSLLEVADLPKVADHKTRWVDAPVLLSRRLEIKSVATLRRRIPSSIATTRHSGGAGATEKAAPWRCRE